MEPSNPLSHKYDETSSDAPLSYVSINMVPQMSQNKLKMGRICQRQGRIRNTCSQEKRRDISYHNSSKSYQELVTVRIGTSPSGLRIVEP